MSRPIAAFGVVVAFLALICCQLGTAFPFGKDSGVVELTPATLNGFLNTHKPVFIMFYAPWCGHCKQLHPEWEKFAKGVKDVVRIGAVNADAHREIGGQFGIQGFPTIKYWKMGPKKGMKPLDYQGQRSAAALHNAAVAEITHAVVTATGVQDFNTQIGKASAGMAAVLFSSKSKSPPIFSVLSQSPHFKGKIAFVLVTDKAKKLAESFSVEKSPAFMLLSLPKEGERADANGFVRKDFDGKMEYPAMAKFLQAALGIEGKTEEEPPAEEAKPKPTKSAGGADKKKSGAAAEAGGEGEKEKKAPEEKKPPRPAAPVRPVPLTAEGFRTFCGPNAGKVVGQQPFCVVSFADPVKYDLKATHEHFSQESVLFFIAPAEKAHNWASDINDALQPMAQIGVGDMVVLRAQKDRTKFLVWKTTDAHPETETLETFIERALAGETTFERNPGFPKLRD